MIIVFSGMDGSGKTIHALRTKKYLLKKAHKVTYRHAIKSSFSEFIAKGMSKVSNKTKSKLEKKLRSSKKPCLLAWGKRITLFFDIILFNLRYHRLKGDKKAHVVCDRYFYDELIQFKYLSLDIDFLSRIYQDMTLEPDIVFYLEVSPETAFKRKPEYEFNYYKKKSLLYHNEIKKLRNTVTIKSYGIPLVQKKIESVLRSRLK